MMRPFRRTAPILVLALACPRPGLAHDGPPFPIIVDRLLAPYIVSVWTDPDIGTGTFYVVLEAADDTAFREPVSVSIAVRPVSGRLPEAVYRAQRQRVRYGARFIAEVEFDRGELWDVRIVIEAATGETGELVSRVEPTPDGVIGPIGLVVYAVPFLLVAALWLRAAAARRHLRVQGAATAR